MTKGQRAMAVAMMFPEAEKRGRGKTNAVLNTGFSSSYVAHARTIISSAPELVESVLNGARPLNDAYDDV